MTAREQAARDEAAMWWGRMHGPEAENLRGEFERWHGGSPLHAAEYAVLERTWDLAAELGATEMGRSRSLTPRRHPLAWGTAPRVALAAAAMVVVVLTLSLWPSTNSVLHPIAVAHATAVGEIRTVTLPDGSTATLDTDTRLEVRFDDKARIVTLERGRARFDVRPDPARSFLLASGGRIVSAQDSGFDVQLTPAGLRIQSLRGTLEVRPRESGAASDAELRLAQGQIVRFVAGRAPRAEPAGKGSDLWVQGMLVFHGAPLSAVLEETNRYSSRHIVLGDPTLEALKVTGTFRPVPSESLAASIAAAFDLAVEQKPAGNFVLVRKTSGSSPPR